MKQALFITLLLLGCRIKTDVKKQKEHKISNGIDTIVFNTRDTGHLYSRPITMGVDSIMIDTDGEMTAFKNGIQIIPLKKNK